jgi:hypothetical protein
VVAERRLRGHVRLETAITDRGAVRSGRHRRPGESPYRFGFVSAGQLDQRLGECGPGGARRRGRGSCRRRGSDGGHLRITIRRFAATVTAITARKVSQGPSTGASIREAPPVFTTGGRSRIK